MEIEIDLSDFDYSQPQQFRLRSGDTWGAKPLVYRRTRKFDIEERSISL